MKSTLLNLFFISFIASCSFAQNKLNDNASFQNWLEFKSDVSKQEAINQYLIRQGLDSNNSFVAKNESVDETGMEHQRNQQFHKGIKVEFGTLITHAKDGNVLTINSELYNAASVNIIPSLSSEECFSRAINQIGAVKYLWEDTQQALIVDYKKPQGELVILPLVKSGELKLAYKYDIYAVEPLSREEVFVDAHTGNILFKNPIIKHATSENTEIKDIENFEALVTGIANTKYSGVRSIETRFDVPLNMYVLNDLTRGAQIVTYNCERIVATYQNVHFKDNDNNWTSAEHANSFYDNAAQDAHWATEMTYDFWKNIFNRNGFDNNNSLMRSYVHYKATAASLSNAYWNGSFMTYGDGTAKPFTSIDICGHEIGHAICTYTANLAYQNQSGAMNESYSDIWGACIEHFGRTGAITGTPVAAVWRIGEDVTSGGLRNMGSPLLSGDPDTYRGTNWISTADEGPCSPTSTNDYCGVHSNSGVMNHWFYILTVGKSGTNNAPIAERDTYNVTGIGMQKSSQIAYYTERDYLTPNATFFDARDATLAVVNNLYCSSSPEVVSVTNAWFAVNVGNSFQAIANDVNLKSISANNSANCGVTSVSPTITFENLGTNPITTVTITYNIDGGANSTVVWNGNLTTCSQGTQQITINTSTLSVGRHILNFTTSIANDLNSTNNSKGTYVFVNQTGAINQINTFESPSDDLIAFNETVSNVSLWERGTSNKTVLTNAVALNSKVYATNLNGFYTNNTKSYIMSRCYDLSTALNPILKFDMAFDLEYSADIVYMQYSTNGGVNWSLLGNSTNTNWYNNNTGCPNCVGGEWTGGADNAGVSGLTNGTKQLYSYNLSAFGSAGSAQSNMIFRFVFHSDALENNYDGAIVDNFVIETTLGTNQNSLTDLVVYPNPTANNINVSFTSDSNEKVNITLYDVQGRLIKSNIAETSIGSFNYTMDVVNVPTGFYLLKISQGSLNYNTKIIKN